MEISASVRRGKVWKNDMERIMNNENHRDHAEGDAVEGPVV